MSIAIQFRSFMCDEASRTSIFFPNGARPSDLGVENEKGSLLEHCKCSAYGLPRAVIERLEAIANGSLQSLHILLSLFTQLYFKLYYCCCHLHRCCCCYCYDILSLLLPLSTADDVTLLRELTNGAKLEVLFKDVERRG